MEKILKQITPDLTPIQYNIIMYLSSGAKRRKDFVDSLNIPRTTVYNNLEKIRNKKLIWQSYKLNGKLGRPITYWQIKQAYDLILFNFNQAYNLVLFDKAEISKIPNWAKPIKIIPKKTAPKKPIPDKITPKKTIPDKITPKKTMPKKTVPKKIIPKKPMLKKPVPKKMIFSYILDNQKSKLVLFILDEINKCTYFRIPSLNKYYVNTSLKDINITEKLRRSISSRIGRITTELIRLEIIMKFNKSTFKNLYKGNLFKALDKKMKQNYHIIGLKNKMYDLNLENCICSKCGKNHQKSQCYKNRITNEILCLVCLTKVKKKRNKMRYERTLHMDRNYKKRKYSKKLEKSKN